VVLEACIYIHVYAPVCTAPAFQDPKKIQVQPRFLNSGGIHIGSKSAYGNNGNTVGAVPTSKGNTHEISTLGQVG